MNPRQVLRRCVSCRKLLDRRMLWRVIRDYKDGVVLDNGMGRSAYLCPNQNCLEEARRRKRLQKALRCQVPANIVNALEKRLNLPIDSVARAR